MALNKPRTVFGFCQMTAVRRDTKLPLGTVKVVNNYTGTMSREQKDLYGGCSAQAWDSEDGNVTSDLSVTISEFKPFLYTLAGYTVTTGATELLGSTAATCTVELGANWANQNFAITAATGADLKTGVYYIKVASTGASIISTIDVYAINDNDFARGTTISYADDLLKITTAALAITSGGAGVAVPNTGITVLLSSGSSGMVTGDVASVFVRKPNEGYFIYDYGISPKPIEFAAYFTSQNKANGEFIIDEYPRVKLSSIPAGLTSKDWVNLTLPMKVLYDSDKTYSFRRRDIVMDAN